MKAGFGKKNIQKNLIKVLVRIKRFITLPTRKNGARDGEREDGKDSSKAIMKLVKLKGASQEADLEVRLTNYMASDG